MLSSMWRFLEGRVFVNTTSGTGRVVERGVMCGEGVLSVMLPPAPGKGADNLPLIPGLKVEK